MSPFSADVPQILIRVDRAKAEAMQVGVDTVFDALEQFVGSSFVNQFTLFNHTFQVYVQADGKFRKSADDLRGIFVRGSAGQMVSLANLIRIEHGTGPGIASLYNLRPAATLSGTPAAAYSSGQAIQAIENAAARVLPPGVGIEWTAMSYQEKLVGNTAYVVFAFAVLLVFLVLAAQYESWWLPGAVIFGLPMALLGTATVLLSLGVANNLYTQIGIVLLIALCAKNAILIVELARKRREQGLEIEAAAIEAARIRFRPILMTSIAFILGVLPMVVASGASASARRSLGIAVFSGMLASTAIATLFVPSFYVVLQRLSERTRAGR
ncbi:AcrB/AcrD/AcrF family protein [Paraburkholderia rhizosphaerae]|uniref:AcrB/AcrD/AcrF family protein n=2 Tax=Paraburkholderia rhizosphaerae TaxID=480658 RepID=A0A4R8LTZ1_9BURK|nr:AcrB/AcrD/AcrF family protein [Paraburkholderia rhizosphaerae]